MVTNLGGWKTVTVADADQVHVVPINDMKRHTLTPGCECQPVIEETGDVLDIVIHNSFDGREVFETNKRAVS